MFTTPIDNRIPAREADAPLFIALLAEQRELYQRVREAGDRQADMISQGNTEALLGVLHERQRLIDELSVLNRRIIPHREVWSRRVEDAAPHDRQRVRELIDETQALLEDILRQDEDSRQRLEEGRRRVGDQLRVVNDAGRARNAYGVKLNAACPTPRFADRVG